MLGDFLKEFITLAGKALQKEDSLISAAGDARGEKGGIRRADNERLFQFIVWRAAYSHWPFKMEHPMLNDQRDLVIFDPDHPIERQSVREYARPICEFEMKTWLDAGAPRRVEKIKEDIKKLQNCQTPDSALIIFSANARGETNDQIRRFEDQFLSVRPLRCEPFDFQTLYSNGEEQDFLIAAWPIKYGPLLLKPIE